ncbi:glyoxylate/hydroxypyruvate reductase A [Roseateles sp.]|uniref:2-hydroxyacid dehydrogenase n=1 Tax=Roseateles sp. TaxID=1971397 RepID=UPI002E0CC0CD|nr:glyoxylate/hydroxypyruvate reductase A [Roseateles sp.]
MALLLLSTAERGEVWPRVFAEAGESIFVGEASVADPAAITHIACWVPPQDLSVYTGLKTVISVGAGVDHLPPMPAGIALSRTIAPGIEAMVRDWVVMATLMAHRDVPTYLAQARDRLWRAGKVTAASARTVGILGMGRIGRLAAAGLGNLGFRVRGWSRSGTPVDGIDMFAAADLDDFLRGADILVCLLPLTAATRGILGEAMFAKLPQGARLVHAGRGAHLDMAALSRALDAGRLASAVLDVTDPEPLPAEHPLWSDPRVIITPHVAAQTDAREGALHALTVIRAVREGRPIPGLVARERGY